MKHGYQQAVAKAYGCLATPDVFSFDRERKLRCMGRFDDSRFPDPATVASPDARLGLSQYAAVVLLRCCDRFTLARLPVLAGQPNAIAFKLPFQLP
jgi:hypothetical protein